MYHLHIQRAANKLSAKESVFATKIQKVYLLYIPTYINMQREGKFSHEKKTPSKTFKLYNKTNKLNIQLLHERAQPINAPHTHTQKKLTRSKSPIQPKTLFTFFFSAYLKGTRTLQFILIPSHHYLCGTDTLSVLREFTTRFKQYMGLSLRCA